MNPTSSLPDLLSYNQDALKGLERAIALQSSRFAIILARCNYQRLQSALIDHLLATYPTLQVLHLPSRLPSLLEAIQYHLRLRPPGTPLPAALMVTDLDTVDHLEAILKAANLARDTFQAQVPLPLVLWLDDYVLSQMTQLAQDLKNLGPPTLRFEMPPDELTAGLYREADELFTRFLKGSSDAIPADPLIDLTGTNRLGNELTYALRDLETHGSKLSAELDASLLFAQGRQAHSRLQMEEAKVSYEESLAYWEKEVRSVEEVRSKELGERNVEDGAHDQSSEAGSPASTSANPSTPTYSIALPGIQETPHSPTGHSRNAPHPSSLPPSPSPLNRKATLLLHLGFWWRSLAVLQRSTYQTSLQSARRYFERGLDCFRQSNQSELVARFIPSLAEVLQKQEDWAVLEHVAQEALSLHRQTRDWVREARDHGFLAEVALRREDWVTAQAEAVRAIDLLDQTEQRLNESPDSPSLAEGLQLAKRFQRGWYRFLLGEAQMELGQRQNAIALLEQARQEVDPDADLILYLQILEELIHHYYDDLGDYRRAFEVKLERRRVEYRHNFRAFIGAGALQPHPQVPLAKGYPSPSAMSAEIAASGRQQDVENLLNRLQEARFQIVVIHGPSGVGKSSILNAGLVPALRTITPQGRTTVPITIQTYGSWEQSIADDLRLALSPSAAGKERGGKSLEAGRREAASEKSLGSPFSFDAPGFPPAVPTFAPPVSRAAAAQPAASTPAPASALLASLKAATESNYFIVLVFDQFEDFFFEREELASRQPFYEFLQGCLQQPWVKVVMALREDYLHYLLEIERLVDVSIIDGGLLCSDVRYPLGNFSQESAEAVIRRLTESAQYYLEDGLIRCIVDELARDTGDVRPIELQVVGAQLQRENITTLNQYKALGEHPKEKLVQRFLAETVRDCGPPNQELAQVVLYLLTDEDKEGHLYRPLKTREDLEYELSFLEVEFEPDQLDLVLFILVGSGLVFEIPEDPEDSYQLVHDYLVNYVRQEQTPELLQQLEDAREKQHQTEEELGLVLQERNRVLVGQVQWQRKAIAIALSLMVLSLMIDLVTVLTAH